MPRNGNEKSAPTLWLAGFDRSPQNLADGIFEGDFVGKSECAELADDEGLLQRGEDRLDDGGFEQRAVGWVPVRDPTISAEDPRCWWWDPLRGPTRAFLLGNGLS